MPQEHIAASFLPRVEAALRAGDVAGAVELARAALAMGERKGLLFALRARWHEQNGRFAQACADLEKALQDTPDDPSLLISVSRCLGNLGEFERAGAAARSALAIGPKSAQGNFHLGFALEQLGELDDSRGAYEAALAADPALREAHARLAGLAARRGDWAGARTHAAANPGHPAARLAGIMADMAEGKFADAEKEARALAEAARGQPQICASAVSFLGDALHAQGRAAEAFDAYAEANEIQRRFAGAQFEAEGGETACAMAQRLTREFEAFNGAWNAPSARQPVREHVFVLGFARSGTTLLAEILAGHPGAAVIDERPFLTEAIVEFAGTAEGIERIAMASDESLTRWRQLYWQRVAESGLNGDLVVDKAPFNTLHLPLIARLFPEAKIVLAARDPRDVVFACFRRHFALTPYTYEFLSLETTAAFYEATMRLAELYRARLPLSVLEVRNEDVVADPEKQVERLCEFLQLAPTPEMTQFTRRDRRRAIASPSAADLALGIRQAGAAGWSAYANQLAPVLPVLAPWVERFGYAAGGLAPVG